MGEDGYISLTDFGLAKELKNSDEVTNSFCGTPEYLAPEIIDGDVGHSFPVDWWALGILVYEMMVGFCPFYTGQQNDNNAKMFNSIRTKKPFFPDEKKHGIKMSLEC